MEKIVLKNITCYIVSDEEIWRGKIILKKDGTFNGIANDDFCASFLSGMLFQDCIEFSLTHHDNMDESYSLKNSGSFNNYKYYNGTWTDTRGKTEECYLALEEISSDTLEDDIKKLEKKITDFNKKRKA